MAKISVHILTAQLLAVRKSGENWCEYTITTGVKFGQELVEGLSAQGPIWMWWIMRMEWEGWTSTGLFNRLKLPILSLLLPHPQHHLLLRWLQKSLVATISSHKQSAGTNFLQLDIWPLSNFPLLSISFLSVSLSLSFSLSLAISPSFLVIVIIIRLVIIIIVVTTTTTATTKWLTVEQDRSAGAAVM